MLERESVSPDEIEQLEEVMKRKLFEGPLDEVNRFVEFVEKNAPFDMIIDGANVLSKDIKIVIRSKLT